MHTLGFLNQVEWKDIPRTVGTQMDMKGDIIKQINMAFIDMVSCSIYKADIPGRLTGFTTTTTVQSLQI